MARQVGAKVHADRLRRLSGPRVKSAVLKASFAAGTLIAEFAKSSIIAGGVSGSDHVPSEPGQPPNANTHTLDQSILVIPIPATLGASVIATAPYAAALEFGTSTVVERPFMRPASQAMRPAARRLVAAAIHAVNKGV